MSSQRDAAITILHKHGISCDQEMASHVTQITTLGTQNRELQNVIKQMRIELEQLSEWSAGKGGRQDSQEMPTLDYVRYMEEQVKKMKSENRQLAEQLELSVPQGKPPTPAHVKRSPVGERKQATPTSVDVQAQHRSHLIALSDTIATLHKEKAETEYKVQEWMRKVNQLQDRLKEEEELVMCVCTCVCACACVHTCVCVHVCVCACMCVSCAEL